MKTSLICLAVIALISLFITGLVCDLKEEERRSNLPVRVTLYGNDGTVIHTYSALRKNVHEWSTSLEIDGVIRWHGNYLIQPEMEK